MNTTYPMPVLHVICDVCGFNFHSKDYLKLHLNKLMDSLSGNISNPFFHVNCNVCGLTFHSRDYIPLHLTK